MPLLTATGYSNQGEDTTVLLNGANYILGALVVNTANNVKIS